MSKNPIRVVLITLVSAMLVVQLLPRGLASDYLAVGRGVSETQIDNDDFQLAYNQSYGFFDDISSAQWNRHRRRAREHQNHVDPNHPNGRGHMAKLPAVFYMNNYDPLFACPHVRRLGGPGDGPKWTCDPHRLRRIAADRRRDALEQEQSQSPPQSNCLVYSVGCNRNYQWEVGLAQALGEGDAGQRHCEIHVFDFSGNYSVAEHADQYNIFFHQWGLASSYDDSMTKAFPRQYAGIRDKMFTLEQIMEKLGHTGHVIDIFKVDCEFCEWFTYKDWLKPTVDVRQLLLETHNLPTSDENPQTNKGGYWFPIPTKLRPNEFFDDLQKAGYAMYSKEPNIHPNAGGNGVEFAYIKLHPDFFREDD